MCFRGAKKKPYMTTEQFVKFLNKEQRDPRLNEILYPYYTSKQAIELIEHYESKTNMAAKGMQDIVVAMCPAPYCLQYSEMVHAFAYIMLK